MRLAISVVLALVVANSVVMTAQDDDLARLVPDDRIVVELEMQQVPVSEALEALARAGGLQIFFARDVALDRRPVSLSIAFFEEGDLETILRTLLDEHGLRYRAAGEATLLVSQAAPRADAVRHGPQWLADRRQTEALQQAAAR